MTVSRQLRGSVPQLIETARILRDTGAAAGTADGERIMRMAGTPAPVWTDAMVATAATTLRRWEAELRSHGVDPQTLPAPQQGALSKSGNQEPNPRRQWAIDAAALFDATPVERTGTTVSNTGGWDQATVPPRHATVQQTVAEQSPYEALFDNAPPPPSAQEPTFEPFDYEHSIVGLRGIPVTHLSCVSEKAAEGFTQAGISSVYDLLSYVPLRYIDRTARTPIKHFTPGTTATTIAKVTHTSADTTRSGMRYAKITVRDDSDTLECTFFHAAWMAKRFKIGDEVVVQGKVSTWTDPRNHATTVQMVSPLMDRTGDEHTPVVPVYPQSGTTKDSARAKLTTWQVHRAAMEAIDRMGNLTDTIPDEILSTRGLVGRDASYRNVHKPLEPGREAAARDRLAYDELLRLQLAIGMRRAQLAADPAVAHTPTGVLTDALVAAFPYPLTGAQERAFATIRDDLTKPAAMHRMLQGDVGFGKTVVSSLTLLAGVEGGHQGALMAPTEILATQLFAELVGLTKDLVHPDGRPLRVATLTNKVRTKARRATLAGLADGSIDLVVGTHALLSDDVQFRSLGVVVVDEQHRFGVEQRAQLRAKGPGGATPDTLVMTATPIPRTAALTVFGDLDVTVLDEQPPGRTPVHTAWVDEVPDFADASDPIWASMRSQVAAGRQGFVVCPLVEESETKAAAAATDVEQALANGALCDARVGLVHGKQKPDERADIMEQFRAGQLDVLVATTVIEVGVSVPNATMIVVLEPKSFGIAQLHQLRGRVGRGKYPSRCVLAGPATGDDGTARMEALCSTTDGFKLAEVDLQLRGPGALLGSRQSGMSDLRVASLTTDTRLLSAAREDAGQLLSDDPRLLRRPGLLADVVAALGDDGADRITAS